MRVLIVKTTSMGDVVHAVPVVEDIKRFISDAEIDWLVEDSFADIPRHVAGGFLKNLQEVRSRLFVRSFAANTTT